MIDICQFHENINSSKSLCLFIFSIFFLTQSALKRTFLIKILYDEKRVQNKHDSADNSLNKHIICIVHYK
ncbi:LOW QUALITY PROTEIN: hypothetical protein TorRG33x02_269820 [Trema orientale]|uniref:Uncharacterized protein n=1 Tax=Trema orientale TaxID=63057 RepID=A0A2P5CXP7_TREOI|nr:LOW QUALITY PROTEIN: hypothetical protein TorRG33x02_269820 [Trema orientale]